MSASTTTGAAAAAAATATATASVTMTATAAELAGMDVVLHAPDDPLYAPTCTSFWL